MVVKCKCGEKYVSVYIVRLPRKFGQNGEGVKEITKGTIKSCSKCKGQEEILKNAQR